MASVMLRSIFDVAGQGLNHVMQWERMMGTKRNENAKSRKKKLTLKKDTIRELTVRNDRAANVRGGQANMCSRENSGC